MTSTVQPLPIALYLWQLLMPSVSVQYPAG